MAQATLLVYENFGYNTGTASGTGGVKFDGQGATNTTGMTGTWAVINSGTANSTTVYQQGSLSGVNLSSATLGANNYTGTVVAPSNFVTSGGYMGPVSSASGVYTVTTDNMTATRALAKSVTDTFQDGTTTWFSYVSARAFDKTTSAPKFAIGAASLDGSTGFRGFTALGEAIGAGGGVGGKTAGTQNNNRLYPQFWSYEASTSTYSDHDATGIVTSNKSNSGGPTYVTDSFAWASYPTSSPTPLPGEAQPIANICIGKIEWHDGAPDVISFASFVPTDGALTEVLFDGKAFSSSGWAIQPNLDQSQFDTISFTGARYFMDEIRLATTFTEVIGGTLSAVPEPTQSLGLMGLLGLGALLRNRRK